METVIATSLFQTVPAIMTQMMISRLIISVTNRTTTGEFVVTPSQIMGFKSMPIDEQIFNILVMRLKTQVLHSLSQGNQIDIAFNLTIDIAGDSRLEISLNGQPFVPYVVPSFADARFTPVIANGYRALEGVAHDMGVLCDNLTVNYGTRPVSNIDTISGFGSPQQSFNPQGIDYTSKV